MSEVLAGWCNKHCRGGKIACAVCVEISQVKAETAAEERAACAKLVCSGCAKGLPLYRVGRHFLHESSGLDELLFCWAVAIWNRRVKP